MVHNFVQTRSNFQWPFSGEDTKYKGLIMNHKTGEQLQMRTNTESEGPTLVSTDADDRESTEIIPEDADDDEVSTDTVLDDDADDEVSTSDGPEEDWTEDMEGLTFAALPN